MTTFGRTLTRTAFTSLSALALLGATTFGAGSSPAHAAPAGASDAQTAAFLTKINAYRQQNSLGPLALDQKLQAAADWMSQDVLAHCVDTKDTSARCSGANVHIDSQGRNASARMQSFGYPVGSTYTGENAVQGWGGFAETADQAFTWWQNSPGHNANMLGASFKAIGIARACDSTGCAWVTDFGSEVTQSAGGNTSAAISSLSKASTSAAIKATQPTQPPAGFCSGMVDCALKLQQVNKK